MSVLVLVFLVLTGGVPPAEDGTATGTTTTVTTTDTPGDATTDDGGDTVRKTPIG